jgi:hypothetical protein
MMMMRMLLAGAVALAPMAAMAERRPVPKSVEIDAPFDCQRAVQASAKRDYKWLGHDRWPVVTPDPNRAGGFLLAGDEIELQAPNGNWFRMSYACRWNPQTGATTAGVLGFGRLENAFKK